MSESTEKSTTPTRVVGLQYEMGEGPPQVILKGSGKIAEEIVRKSERGEGPTVVKDSALVDQLYRMPIDSRIGPELYHLVAALLAHVFTIEQKLQEQKK